MRFYRLTLLPALIVVFGGSQIANASSIVNGSFEDPPLTVDFAIFDDIPGWSGGVGGIEIQADIAGDFTARGIAPGEQFVELDTTLNSSMFQDVPTSAGAVYKLVFAYAPRNFMSRPADSNDVEVSWEGDQVALMGGPSLPDFFRQETWTTHSFLVTATSNTGFSRLQFNALGTSDSVGGLIDRVAISQIPEPSSIIYVWSLIGVSFLWFIRRRPTRKGH